MDLVRTLNLKLQNGGLAQISAFKGGSRTWLALACLSHFLESCREDPPLSLWISDEGTLYPETLHYYWKIPLSRLLLIQTKDPPWQTALEAVQTGLFTWLLLRTEQGCHPHFLRKLQLCAEKTKTRILLLSQIALPHWTLKGRYEPSLEYPST